MKRIIRLFKDPHKIITGVGLRLKRRKIKHLYAKSRRDNPDIYRDINQVLHKFHSGGGYVRDMQDYKVYQLYELLKDNRPLTTLEIGSGSSTYAFVRYANETHGVKHTIVDESDKWLQNTKSVIERSGVSTDNCRWMKGTKSIKWQEGFAEICLKENFNEAFDLVFIDGPTLKVDGVQNSRHINTDIFKIFNYFPPKIILVDIRMHTVNEIVRKLGQYYSVRESHLFNLSNKQVNGKFNYFTVFQQISTG